MLLSRFADRITSYTLIPGGGGAYEFTVNGQLAFSKKSLDRFPEDEEIVKIIENH